ncbi:MAG: DNA polymerase III subunit gamma/tau, partial [Bacteroidia bacterium]|nr:DNA polymerase III subunit gamma/tau [Bacteroidia bacterium]
CQKFDFKRIKIEEIVGQMVRIAERESIAYERDALFLIAQKADGGMRDALSIFDQMVNFGNKNVTYAVVLENLSILDYDYFFRAAEYMLARDHAALLLLLNEVYEKGFDGLNFLQGLVEHFRNLLIAQQAQTLDLLETTESARQKYLEQVKSFSPTLLLNAFHLSLEAESNFRAAASPRLQLELFLIKLAHLASAIELVEKKK